LDFAERVQEGKMENVKKGPEHELKWEKFRYEAMYKKIRKGKRCS